MASPTKRHSVRIQVSGNDQFASVGHLLRRGSGCVQSERVRSPVEHRRGADPRMLVPEPLLKHGEALAVVRQRALAV